MPRPARSIPDATVARLPLYHRVLSDIVATTAMVSSDALADLAAVTAAKVRKDLSYLGSYGTRGVGYEVDTLLRQIGRELGLTQTWPVVIVGIGNLGRALAAHNGFSARGFHVVALLDADPEKVGQRVADSVVRPIRDLPEVVAANPGAIGVIATPAAAAQEVADAFVHAGTSAILSFSPTIVSVPPDVSVRTVDLSMELQILSFHQHNTLGADRALNLAGAS